MSIITNLQSTDNGADSLSIINTNLGNLNTDKLEASDITGKEDTSNKENTTLDTSTTKYPTNRLTKEYADGKVADAINDGTTTIAPSQNAVYEALLLKAPLASPTFTGTVTLPSGQALITPALGTPASGVMTNVTGLPAASVVAGSLVAGMKASDHGTAATDQLVNVCYGTGVPPAASTTTEGTLYITYT